MFTGIIEEIGSIQSIYQSSIKNILIISCSKVLENAQIGDSIAVNGVCLTVTRLGHNEFEADISTETFSKTTLATLTVNDPVNLEQALAVGGKLGGHFVQGHVDGVGTVCSMNKISQDWNYSFKINEEIKAYIVEKGSIAINGISLTIASIKNDTFSVAVVPHTRESTILKFLKNGSLVNIEIDILAKYVFQLLNNSGLTQDQNKSSSTLNKQFLQEQGFL